jgi:hypothetical protein
MRLRYYEDFVKPQKKYRAPTEKERAALGGPRPRARRDA